MSKTPGPIPAPYINEAQSVQAGWIGPNGHMDIAWYLSAFDRSYDEPYRHVGLTQEALEKTGSSTFAAEMHIAYRRELLLGDPLRIETILVGFDAKRMHWVQRMFNARENFLAATAEWLILHVNLRERRVAPFPGSMQAALQAIRDAHAALPRPGETGRRIDLENRLATSQATGR